MPPPRQPIRLLYRPGAFIFTACVWFLLSSFATAQTAAPAGSDPLLQPLPEWTLPAPGQSLPASEQFFDELLAGAATGSPGMREQEDMVSAADASRFRSWLRHMPVISASYSAGIYYQTSYASGSGSTLTPGGSVTLQASLPIYHWGAFDAQTELGILTEQRAQNDAVLAYAQLCLDLRKRYLNLVVEKAQSAVLAARVDTAKLRLDRSRLLFQQGRATATQLNDLELNWKGLSARQEANAASFKNDVAEFCRVSGSSSFTANDVPDRIFLPVVDQSNLQAQYEDYKKRGIGQSPLARANELEEKALDRQIIMTNASRKPMFDLTASVSQEPYINGNNNSLKFGTIFFFGITGTWNLFDRGDSFAATQALYAQKRQADTKFTDTRAQAFNDAEANLDRIDLGLRALGVLKAEYQQEQDDYRREQILVGAGRADTLAVDSARDALLDTGGQILSRQADVATAYYSFLADVYRDPALANAPPFTKPR